MPLREYTCEKCGTTFERYHAGSESAMTQCPKCKATCRPLAFSAPARRNPEYGIQQ
jgi:putative FmdB family regulatory protein